MTYYLCHIEIFSRHLETIKRDTLEEIIKDLEARYGQDLHIGNGFIEVINDPDYSLKITKVTEEILYR